jgi:hypothetical protein
MINPQQKLFFLPVKSKVILIFMVVTTIWVTLQTPIIAQRITPTDVWQQVYQQLPNLPKENQYISKETRQQVINNTLIGRLIRYHVYLKARSPISRLDWKLTLADYLDANEIIYADNYPSRESLRENPLAGDRLAISKLSRFQRNQLIEVLMNIFSPKNSNQNGTSN